MKLRVGASLLLAAALLPLGAQANPTPFNLDRLSLNPGGETLVLDTGDGLQAGRLRAALAGQYQHDPLVYRENGETVGALIGYRLSAHLTAAYGFTDWFEAGLELPVILHQGGDRLVGADTIQAAAIGAPRLQGRFTLLRESRGGPMDLGFSVGVALPSGGTDAFAEEAGSGFAVLPRIGLGKRLGSTIRLGVEAGVTLREEAVLSPYAVDPGDEIGNELGGGIVASTLGDGLRGELSLLGRVPFGSAPTSAELLGGLRYPFAPAGVEVFAMAGPAFGSTPGTPLFRVLAGVALAPAGEPSPQPCEADQSCPHQDKDGDGIINAEDACPTVPGIPELQGCPDGDDDGDGIPNLQDRCPDVPGEPDNDGCPYEDRDGDGIPDHLDRCPDVPGVEEHDGCPAPAPAPTEVAPPAVIESGVLLLSEKRVLFETDQSTIGAASAAVLREVAEILRKDPSIETVRIEGHTDSTGSVDYNQRLSESRAQAVRAFLIGEGVDPKRLESLGHGPHRPIAPNESVEGRRQNRRVDFEAKGK